MSVRLVVPIAILAAYPLAAQEQARDTARVAPVVVTATSVPLSQSALPVAVTVITGAELKLRGITTVADALNGMTSTYVAQSGSPGSQTSLFLRGGESKYVKVLVDGVPANDPGGAYDFASLSTDNVERIEIVRGPASVIYGADAVTGVVHVITRRGQGAARSEAEVRWGMAPRERLAGAPTPDESWSLDAGGAVTGELSAASYSLSLDRHGTNGLYELNNNYYNNVLSGRFHVAPAANTELRLSLRYTDSRFHYPTSGSGAVGDSNAFRAEDRTIIGVELDRRISTLGRAALTLNSSVNDGVSDDQMDAAGGSSTVTQDKTRRRGAGVRVHLVPTSRIGLTLGAQAEQQDHRNQLQSQSSFGPFNSNFRAGRRNTAAYAELVLTPLSAITATLGARVDDNQQFGSFGTGRAGVSWRPVAATRFRLTAGTAYREPTFAENYSSGFASGNPDLEPERAAIVDGGVDQELFAGRVEASLTGFSQRFSNMIDYDPTDSCGFSYCNMARARSNGIEADLRARLRGAWWAGAGATFLKTKVLEPGFDQSSGGLYRRGESLVRRPERKIAGELSYRGPQRLSGALRVLAVGTRQDRDFSAFPSTPVTLPSYERVDLGLEFRLPETARARSAMTLRVENLTDAEYQNVFNFLAPRRTISLGVRSSF